MSHVVPTPNVRRKPAIGAKGGRTALLRALKLAQHARALTPWGVTLDLRLVGGGVGEGVAPLGRPQLAHINLQEVGGQAILLEQRKRAISNISKPSRIVKNRKAK